MFLSFHPLGPLKVPWVTINCTLKQNATEVFNMICKSFFSESTISIEEGDQLVSEFILENCPNVPLAGNSVHMDANFMRKEMPMTMKALSYRIVDVSSVKEICRRWYPKVFQNAPSKNSQVFFFYFWVREVQRSIPTATKFFFQSAVGGAHTAKYDIIKSIEELKYYQDNIFIPTEN